MAKMVKITANVCENRKNYGKDTASEHRLKAINLFSMKIHGE